MRRTVHFPFSAFAGTFQIQVKEPGPTSVASASFLSAKTEMFCSGVYTSAKQDDQALDEISTFQALPAVTLLCGVVSFTNAWPGSGLGAGYVAGC